MNIQYLLDRGVSVTLQRGEHTQRTMVQPDWRKQHLMTDPKLDIQEGDVFTTADGRITGTISQVIPHYLSNQVIYQEVHYTTGREIASLPNTVIYATNSVVAVQSQLTNVALHIGALPQASDAQKAELQALITALQAELITQNASTLPEAEVLGQRLTAVTEEAVKPAPDKELIDFQFQRLQKAATNLAKVVPTILPIVTALVQQIQVLVP